THSVATLSLTVDRLVFNLGFFFFSSRRRHTRFKCDWSSDVCSSDLRRSSSPRSTSPLPLCLFCVTAFKPSGRWSRLQDSFAHSEIGRASCRERVWTCRGSGSV